MRGVCDMGYRGDLAITTKVEFIRSLLVICSIPDFDVLKYLYKECNAIGEGLLPSVCI